MTIKQPKSFILSFIGNRENKDELIYSGSITQTKQPAIFKTTASPEYLFCKFRGTTKILYLSDMLSGIGNDVD